jgi:hypothetical protein
VATIPGPDWHAACRHQPVRPNERFCPARGQFAAKFALRCDESTKLGLALNAPVAELIREARALGARVIIVEMPMSPDHRRSFYRLAAWNRYRHLLEQLVEASGAECVSACDWIQQSTEFADNLHLSPAGATDFSRRLALRTLNHAPPAHSVCTRYR